MAKTVRFFNTYEPVSNFYRDLVPYLLAQGAEVEIVISRGLYRKGRVLEDALGQHPNLRIIKTASFGRNAYEGGKSKAIITLVYMVSAYFYALFGRRADVNVYLSQPPFIPLLGFLVALIRRQAYYCVVMDVQPQMAVEMGMMQPDARMTRLLKRMTALSWRKAEGVIVIGRCMAKTATGMGVASERVHVIQNWADTEKIVPIKKVENRLRKEMGWQNHFVVMYAGNIGIPQSFDELLDSAENLRENDDIRFVLIGGGAKRSTVAEQIAQRRLTNVELHPFLHEQYLLAEILSAGDAHYVSLRDGCTGLAVPSKSYGVLAAGRPIFYVGSADAEVAQMVCEEQIGASIQSGSADELTDTIRAFANDSTCWQATCHRARHTAENIYSTQRAITMYANLILNNDGDTMTQIATKPATRFRWSHQLKIHRLAVRAANKMLHQIPFSIKYAIGQRTRQTKPPYSLLNGATVMQIGAPFDTLKAGRSRGMYFSLMAGDQGRVFIVEPDPISVETFRNTLRKQNIDNTTVLHSGAWSEETTIKLHVDRRHPATNFSSGTVDYDDDRLNDYQEIEVRGNTVDALLAEQGVEKIDLVSITTNWAELEILQGMTEAMKNGLTYICLAFGNPGTDYKALMSDYGYDFLSYDDRGLTFKRRATA